ncbi:MAG: MaoC family dehydratase N-terminal domain-containing protein [Armatimonadota bacterium]|nr:MaoC family dehydratase N-terminal domain-containing protein [Armatimonadota bacterium]
MNDPAQTADRGAAMAELPGDLRTWIGREHGPVRAPGPIEWSDVRRYVNATGDRNPLWGAADLEANPSRIGALAPPGMILDVLRPEAGGDQVTETGARPFPGIGGLSATIEVPGEVARLNAGTEVEWLRPLRIGDWIAVTFRITGIEMRTTADGPAVFIVEERRYVDQRGEPVAVARQTTVRRLSGPRSGAS